MYSISLSGGGDNLIYFVNAEVFNWVVDGGSVPQQVIDNITADHAMLGTARTQEEIIRRLTPNPRSSSPDNDRALGLCKGKSIVLFYSLSELTTYVRENNITILGEYEGYIY